jgi:hypothetical protein
MSQRTRAVTGPPPISGLRCCVDHRRLLSWRQSRVGWRTARTPPGGRRARRIGCAVGWAAWDPPHSRAAGSGTAHLCLTPPTTTRVVTIPEAVAFEAAPARPPVEGIFSGPSTGANLLAALDIACRIGPGHRVVHTRRQRHEVRRRPALRLSSSGGCCICCNNAQFQLQPLVLPQPSQTKQLPAGRILVPQVRHSGASTDEPVITSSSSADECPSAGAGLAVASTTGSLACVGVALRVVGPSRRAQHTRQIQIRAVS